MRTAGGRSRRSPARATAIGAGVVARQAALLLFVALVFATGGGARDDITSLILLRPASALFAAYALTVATREDVRQVRWPLIGLAALGGWMAVQLVPLPPGWWTALPGRGAIAAADQLAGLGAVWRPITLSPSRTFNSLASLIVPLAALLLTAVQREAPGGRIVGALLGAGLASALLGLAQIAGPPDGPLYFYRVTNGLSAVGLFANRNHHAFFLAALIPLCGWAAATAARRHGGNAAAAAIFALAALFTAVVLLTGSRTGLAVLVVALAIGGGMAVLRWPRRGGRRRWLRIAAIGGAIAAATVAVVLARYGMTPVGLTRIAEGGMADDLRIRVLPTLWRMLADHAVPGAGFGTFEHLFHVYEPDALLKATSFNQAHDDWLQLAIEGGLPAMAIAAAAVGCGLRSGVRLIGAMRRRDETALLGLAALAALAILALASLTDYPLRVPSLMAFAAICAALVTPRTARN